MSELKHVLRDKKQSLNKKKYNNVLKCLGSVDTIKHLLKDITR